MSARCWALSANLRAGVVRLSVTLRDPSGRLLDWCIVEPVDPHEPRQAVLAARQISQHTHGAIGAGTVMRRIRNAAERAA